MSTIHAYFVYPHHSTVINEVRFYTRLGATQPTPEMLCCQIKVILRNGELLCDKN